MIFKKNIDFFFFLFENNTIPEPFTKLKHRENDENIENLDYNKTSNQAVFSVKSIPDYINTNFNTDHFNVIRVPQYHKGYSIKLDQNIESVGDFLKLQFPSSSKRAKINRYVKRLETSFDIKYKMLFGKISKSEYDLIMSKLRDMLILRFNQKEEINERLLEWDRIKSMFFSLINERKGAFFVIYENDKPIVISLNYNINKIMFSSILAYDIDYSKFGLGHVAIYRQLEWCIKNDYYIFEMGRGDWEYKRRWSNNIYSLEHNILYAKKCFGYKIYGLLEALKIKFIEYLRSKKINIFYHGLRAKIRPPKRYVNKYLNYQFVDIKNDINENCLIHIDYKSAEYSFLKKPLHDFLYSNMVNINDTNILKCDIEHDTYIFKTKNKAQKILFMG